MKRNNTLIGFWVGMLIGGPLGAVIGVSIGADEDRNKQREVENMVHVAANNYIKTAQADYNKKIADLRNEQMEEISKKFS